MTLRNEIEKIIASKLYTRTELISAWASGFVIGIGIEIILFIVF